MWVQIKNQGRLVRECVATLAKYVHVYSLRQSTDKRFPAWCAILKHNCVFKIENLSVRI